MNRRTKILTALFGVAMGYAIVARVVYPSWIRPLVTIDERIAERREELAKLEALQAEVDRARFEYRRYVERNGAFEAGRVETDVRDRLNRLIEKHKLQNVNVAPSRPVEDRKTGLTTTVVTVSAVGTLESSVGFLRDVSELPELVRLANPVVYPAGSGPRGKDKDLFNLRVPVEILVLPQNKVAGRIDPAGLKKPEQFVRHAGRDYSPIWAGTPFTEFVPLAPLRVDVQRTVVAEVGQAAGLSATPSGGDGNYTFAWMPAEGLNDASSPHPTLDTSSARSQSYTVTLTDGAKSNPATATVMVTIREKPPPPPPVETQPVIPQPVAPVVRRWPDGRSLQIVMTLMRTINGTQANEVMVANSRTHEETFYRRGDDFDGGKLVYVHQTGALVHRNGEYFVYPLGGTMDDHMEASLAGDYPELKSAAERAREVEIKRKAEQEARIRAEVEAQARKRTEESARAAAASALLKSDSAQGLGAPEGIGQSTAAAAENSAERVPPSASAPVARPGADSTTGASESTGTVPSVAPTNPGETGGQDGVGDVTKTPKPGESPPPGTASATPPAGESRPSSEATKQPGPTDEENKVKQGEREQPKKPVRQNRPSRPRNRPNQPNPSNPGRI